MRCDVSPPPRARKDPTPSDYSILCHHRSQQASPFPPHATPPHSISSQPTTRPCSVCCGRHAWCGVQVEVGVVSGKGRFHTLDEDAIEEHLVAINEMES